ncbi:hypothetical protein [Paenibacillus taichungensis]
MLLEQCGIVSQGVIPSRVQTLPSSDSISLSLFTMKEMNESLGIEYHGSTDRIQEVHVLKSKLEDLPLAKEGMVLINLTAHRAVAIRSEYVGKLITSNFAIINPNKYLHALYLEWYFNEHPNCRKQLRIAMQGTIVAALSIQMLRALPIELPSMNKQQLISSVYRDLYRKKRLVLERVQLEEQLMQLFLLRYIQEEKNDDNRETTTTTSGASQKTLGNGKRFTWTDGSI